MKYLHVQGLFSLQDMNENLHMHFTSKNLGLLAFDAIQVHSEDQRIPKRFWYAQYF